MPKAKITSVQLFASSLRIPDSPEDHGYKHLLEHLILKGQNKDLDDRMESKGIFFTGRTLRDAMQIEFKCQPNQIPDTLLALQEILQPVKTTQAEINSETAIMKQELALEPDSQRLMNAEWTAAFGTVG